MLYQSIKNFKLPRGNTSIQFFSPSFDDSCVAVYTDNNNSLHLAHIGKQENILFERPIEKGCDSFAMVTNQSMVFLQLNKSRVTQINFRSRSIISFLHTFVFSESDSKKLTFFQESKLLCVRQHGSHTENTLKLTYYSYPINQHTTSIVVYESEQKQWEYGNKLRKGDNKSQIIWFKVRQNNYLQFHTFQVRGQQGNYEVYTIKDASFSLLKDYSYLAISDIWQIKESQFLVACTSPLLYRLRTRPEILHVTNSCIRLLQGTQEIPEDTYLDTRINLGSFSMLLFILPQDQEEQSQTVTFHLDHGTLQAIKTRQLKQNAELTAMQLDFDHSIYMTLVFKEEEPQKLSIRFTKLMHPKEVALHFMLHINEDFDDDLLQDSLELLDLI